MENLFLHEKISAYKTYAEAIEVPEIISKGLSSKILLREYQEEALRNFIIHFNKSHNKQVHNLFHMATGSGKTVIMAGLILYLYTKGYRKFLFFVNQTNVLEKTIDNFTNPLSTKYLFNEVLEYLGNKINIKRVDNFSGSNQEDIEILFTTTQKLHIDLLKAKENSITYDDFEREKVVFISDESHHINSLTKKTTKDEEEAIKSWEYSVSYAFKRNRESILLEFTATCDLKDKNVLDKYKDKIVFNYPLASFRESGYTKDFQNFATDTNLWTRTLIALVMSEYRRFLFADLKLNIKPVLMLKSQKISESESFYFEFFKKIKGLYSYELEELEKVGIEELKKAIHYFKEKDRTLENLLYSIKNSFTEDTSIIMNGSSDNNREKQLLVNSLEDAVNPIRTIFAVDMLNEGWDVLNLFDIVRLYDTRQGSGKVGKVGAYTIKEAQLIGRGARYCPFVDGDEELKFKRKYDKDMTNRNRILETMYFHSKNDSQYISELKQALIATGLQASEPIILEYRLKEEFKKSEFYQNALVYSNKKIPKSRAKVLGLEANMRSKIYSYTSISGKGKVVHLINENESSLNIPKMNLKSLKFKEIDLNILLGAIDCFEELKFSLLKNNYPSLSSKKEFLISDKFLGNTRIDISYCQDELLGKEIFQAVKLALSQVSSHMYSVKPEFVGTKEFTSSPLKDVLRDKKIYLEKIIKGGKGESQNQCLDYRYSLNLNYEDWYVFNDNYGTSEEKFFIKDFKIKIEPKLKEKGLKYYLIRNERIPELAIYSFEKGERFEPDFLLFVQKESKDGKLTYQTYIEPKGTQLLSQDKWKEDFCLELKQNAVTEGVFSETYKVIGLPFFNSENREAFEEAINQWLQEL